MIHAIPRNIRKTHFITVKGKTTDTYKINDPNWKDTTTLESYDNQFDTIFDTAGTGGFRRFTRKTVEKGQIEIHANCSIEFLITDSQGRRLGFDPFTMTIVNDNLNGYYGASDVIYPLLEDGGTPSPEMPVGRTLAMDIEETEYSLQTYGTGTGTYTLEFSIGLPANGGEVDIAFFGVTQEGLEADYPITITTSPETSKVEHIITLADIKQDVEILFQLEDIDNQGIKNSLLKKLEAVEKAEDRNDNNTVENILGAFKNEVEAQKRKHISEKGAKILLEDVDYLIGAVQKG